MKLFRLATLGRWVALFFCLNTVHPLVRADQLTAADDAFPPRLIVLTDIGNEPDDAQSLIRLLLYSNEIEIAGLIASTSRHLPEEPRQRLIEERITAYGKVLANLRHHDVRYPDAAALLKRVRTGSAVYGMHGVGPGKETAASRLIIETVDRSDDRPVWIAVWGGAADLAQALWSVREQRSAQALDAFIGKLRVYSISDQDNAGPWLRATFPQLFWITSIHGFSRYALATSIGISSPWASGGDPMTVSEAWLDEFVRAKGSLGKLYPPTAFIMEGDSPSFMGLIPNGLNVPERPDWGGWGGRYEKIAENLGLWASTYDVVVGVDGVAHMSPQATIWRWRNAFQHDFAARMAWSVAPGFEAANHPPRVMLNDYKEGPPLRIRGCAGQPIALSAAGSMDPDGDELMYRWWVYREASGLFSPEVALTQETGLETEVLIGTEAQIDQFVPPSVYDIHVILEVTDSGSPSLTRYRRAIITVPGARVASSVEDGCAVRPVVRRH